MGNNAFLNKMAAERQAFMEVAQQTAKQLMLDTCQITLHEQFGWGYERIKRFSDAWGDCYNEYFEALMNRMESDVWQVRLDRALDAILAGHQELIPFKERYPYVKTPGYDRLPRR